MGCARALTATACTPRDPIRSRRACPRRRPAVAFVDTSPLRVCMTGEPTIMPIQLTGPAPFKLTYAVQLGEEQKAFMVHLRRERGLAQSKRIGHVCTDTTVPAACLRDLRVRVRRHIRPGGQLDNLRAGPTAIQVEGVTVRGRYRVLLRQVTDGVGCTADAQQERTIVADRVTASLVCSASWPWRWPAVCRRTTSITAHRSRPRAPS